MPERQWPWKNDEKPDEYNPEEEAEEKCVEVEADNGVSAEVKQLAPKQPGWLWNRHISLFLKLAISSCEELALTIVNEVEFERITRRIMMKTFHLEAFLLRRQQEDWSQKEERASRSLWGRGTSLCWKPDQKKAGERWFIGHRGPPSSDHEYERTESTDNDKGKIIWYSAKSQQFHPHSV